MKTKESEEQQKPHSLEALRIQHANELFLLKRKFKLEEYFLLLQNNIEDIKINNTLTNIVDCIESYGCKHHFAEYLAIKVDEPLYFEFGKYKNRIVQDIFEQDQNYCAWFVNVIRGEDLNTLKILNYLNHRLEGRYVFTSNIYDGGLQLFMELLPLKILSNEPEMTQIKEFLHTLRTYEYFDNCVYDHEDIGLNG